jgi:RNA polymerase sigma-70 factor (ECF subfamily)
VQKYIFFSILPKNEVKEKNLEIRVVFRNFAASNGQKISKTEETMTALEQQFSKTVAEHKSTIYTVCYMFSQDADEVNDLFQEVLVNLWKGFGGFEHRSDIKTWIYRVALNTCISLDRKKKHAKEVRLTMDINLFEDRDEDTRQVDMLHKRISKLQPFDRAIVLLWLENLSYEEIGQIVGISTKNVSVRLFRIREQLKQMSNN